MRCADEIFRHTNCKYFNKNWHCLSSFDMIGDFILEIDLMIQCVSIEDNVLYNDYYDTQHIPQRHIYNDTKLASKRFLKSGT